MLPVFKPGHVLLAVRDGRELHEGQVVVIRHGGLEKVKRIRYIKDDRIFVEGDNQLRSTDSRSFGWLHRSAVVAHVVWPRPVAWPWLLMRIGGVIAVALLVAVVAVWLFF